MLRNQSFVSSLIQSEPSKIAKVILNALAIVTGVTLIGLFAQLSIRLPYTLVPITGQTFAVALVALLWGRTRGTITVASYLVLGGAFNLPIFANAASGLTIGLTTLGYLFGMMAAAFVMGSLADRGWTKSFFKTYLATFIGSIVTFSFGLLVLSHFVPNSYLLTAGLWPFLPGDFIKSIAASYIVSRISR